ncbi:hypothetical protein [Thermoactinospora rubra]|uniref:hypothetical protein n=1 Tax=Thermoactinospora rubra TaxID=1088767 RepID=UPI001180FD83|nr:hypothetical protein [Thermoactinospora rubra]
MRGAVRRHRFGRIAALLAACYVAAAVAFGVVALATGDPSLLRSLTGAYRDQDILPPTWWVEALLVAAAVLQGWAYWQVLRGRLVGEPVSLPRPVRLLRAALYLSVACSLLYRLPIPDQWYQWWFGLPADLVQFAVVGLFFVVLAGSLPRWLRLAGLVAGVAGAAIELVNTVAYGLEAPRALEFLWHIPTNAVHLLWLVPVLIGQARDARWSRTTVRIGVASAWLSSLLPGSIVFGFFGWGGVDYRLVILMLLGILGVLGMVWEARSAHELAGPPPARPPITVPSRLDPRLWPLAAVAVVLPLVPAAVNLAAYGMPVWIGPRGAVESFFYEFARYSTGLLWVAVDVLVGVGAPAVLVLLTVVRGTPRLLRVTIWALSIAAAVGAVSALTYEPDLDGRLIPDMDEDRLGFYPFGLFTPDADGRLAFGISPLWYCAALAASALLLHALYGTAPPGRPRHHVLVAALAPCLAVLFLPAADQPRGPVTTAEECVPREPWKQAALQPLTGPRAFICAARSNRMLPDTTPDQVLLAHGRRWCAVYTRNDPRELARVQAVEGVNVRSLAGELSGICPPADAAVKAAQAADDREFAAFQAEERRKCDATPRHRPLIKPAKAIRLKEPEWPEVGLELYEPTEGHDPADDGTFEKSLDNGLVAGGPGHLFLHTHSDFHVCVTLETYTRRPPVETKGWDHVVEVGYDSPTGDMRFIDGLSGTELPDLSLNGRKGHYRIRVHFAWFPWKGEKYGTQRLLIMAYPGPGDKVITYRKPRKAQ